jgi:hypothetical protein
MSEGRDRHDLEGRDLDARIVAALRYLDDHGHEIGPDGLQELTPEQKAGLDALGPDFIDRLLAEQRGAESPAHRRKGR